MVTGLFVLSDALVSTFAAHAADAWLDMMSPGALLAVVATTATGVANGIQRQRRCILNTAYGMALPIRIEIGRSHSRSPSPST